MDRLIAYLASFLAERDPNAPPTLLQRAIVALFIAASTGILWFVYGIFVAIPVFLFELGLFGATPTQTATVCLLIGAAIGALLGLRNAADYWLHYDHAE